MSIRLGACVARARLHARLGSPMPTNTTSPSRSSLAATQIINSRPLASGEGRSSARDFAAVGELLIAIIHARTDSLVGREARFELRLHHQVLGAIADA